MIKTSSNLEFKRVGLCTLRWENLCRLCNWNLTKVVVRKILIPLNLKRCTRMKQSREHQMWRQRKRLQFHWLLPQSIFSFYLFGFWGLHENSAKLQTAMYCMRANLTSPTISSQLSLKTKNFCASKCMSLKTVLLRLWTHPCMFRFWQGLENAQHIWGTLLSFWMLTWRLTLSQHLIFYI